MGVLAPDPGTRLPPASTSVTFSVLAPDEIARTEAEAATAPDPADLTAQPGTTAVWLLSGTAADVVADVWGD